MVNALNEARQSQASVQTHYDFIVVGAGAAASAGTEARLGTCTEIILLVRERRARCTCAFSLVTVRSAKLQQGEEPLRRHRRGHDLSAEITEPVETASTGCTEPTQRRAAVHAGAC